MKSQIFEEIWKKIRGNAQLYGSTESEKKNAGVVIGSPVLPDVVYKAFKIKKQGE